MTTIRKSERKPLSFSTTMRNPDRIAGFISCLLPFENMILTSGIINDIIKNVLRKKLYYTMYLKRTSKLKTIFDDDDKTFSDDELSEIIANSPQDHKEADFAYGWDSRFDTWFKLPMEFGFVFYAMGQPIKISNTGHMLIDAFNEIPANESKIQSVLLNAMMKYQSNNPFRRNENANVPLLLLLNVLKLLKNDKDENGAGVSRQELSLFICWKDNDALSLYKMIKSIRNKVKFTYSDEYMYEICLDLLGADDTQRKRFKMNQICGEAVDEYIRKMRSTGIVSLRGNGRFIDFNMLEIDTINYVISHYSTYATFKDKNAYYEYMGCIDTQILSIQQSSAIDTTDTRKKALYKFATEYSESKVFEELLIVCNKKDSKDSLLKYISAPTRLEFLTSIALVQQFKGLDVNPNYSVDDEGLPTFTAGGGVADIVCYDDDYDSFFEVTLMRGRQEQLTNEIVPIRRHLLEQKENKAEVFSVFVAPKIHEDTKEMADWYKHKENIDILTFDITEFISAISQYAKASQLLQA